MKLQTLAHMISRFVGGTRRIVRRSFTAGLAAVVAGCARNAAKPIVKPAPAPKPQLSASLLLDLGLEKPATISDPAYVLRCADPEQAKALLWDAGIGVNVGPMGTAFDAQGTPLPCFRCDKYGPDENIQAADPVLGFSVRVNGRPIKPSPAGYSQSLDMRYGLLTTHFFAQAPGGWLEVRASEAIDSEVLVQVEFVGPKGDVLSIEGVPSDSKDWEDCQSALTLGRVLDTSGKRPVGAKSGVQAKAEITLPDGAVTWRFSAFRKQLWDVKGYPWRRWDSLPYALKWRNTVANQKTGASIEIDGPIEDQRAVNSFIYYLRGGAPASYEPISPMSVSSSLYGGHTFWDADIWLSPAMAFIDPNIVQDVAQYRIAHMQAPPAPPFSWESAITGKELAPPEFANEIHIDGDVLWNMEFAKALGLPVDDEKVKARVAEFYMSRSIPGPDGERSLPNVKSPDENHTGSNDLYTNLLAQWTLDGETWKPKASPVRFALPHDATSFLTYDGDTLRSYKQAASVLAIYPLQYPPAEAQARTMLNRFEDKVIPNGPAMSDSVHALIWARLGEADKAYDVWAQSWKPFVTGPMLLFSEKRNQDRTYFTTGAAGCLQTVIYGFLGFRVDEQPKPGAAWQTKLRNGRRLSIDPHLPSAWKSVTFRNFVVLGRRYTLTVRREGNKMITTVR